MKIYRSKFLNIFIDNNSFPVQSTLLVPEDTENKDEFEPERTKDPFVYTTVNEDVSSIPLTWKMDSEDSIQLNTLRNLARRQEKIIRELIDKDALVPNWANVYSFYINDYENVTQDHERDELPYHCIYVVLGSWRDKRKMFGYLKKRLKPFEIHCISESYNSAYKKRKGVKS